MSASAKRPELPAIPRPRVEAYAPDDDDIIKGDDGNDTVYGGAGNDHIEGGNQNDVLFGVRIEIGPVE